MLRGDTPFLIYRDGADAQQLVLLEHEVRLTVGRRQSNEIALHWDSEVSRLHAALERLGDDWAVSDDGLSSNGTYVNGVRIGGRRRLADGDEMRFGKTIVVFRAPGRGQSNTTLTPGDLREIPRLTDAQRGVLIALARPYRGSGGFATPARNKDVAAEVVLSVDGVKSILRVLFTKFGVEGVPQNEKRVRLVERAFQAGVIAEDDL